jgi:O-antigen/teichoic acid export membrane protein
MDRPTHLAGCTRAHDPPAKSLTIAARLRRSLAMERVMLANTASLVGTSMVTLPSGFVYWWIAAHHFPAASVGVASASVSAMILLSILSVLGFGTLLIGELPRRPDRARQLVTTALLTVASVGLGLGIAFAVTAPAASSNLRPLSENIWTVILFAAGVSLTAVTTVLDSVVIGILRGGLQFWRNAVLGVSKAALLWLIAVHTAWRSGLTIYGTWAAGALFSVAFLAVTFALRGGGLSGCRPNWQLVRSLRKSALWHHGVNLGLQAPVYTLPIIVTALLSAAKGAYFYAAWMIATLVFIVPQSLSTVLFAMSAANPAALTARLRQTVRHSAAVAAAAIPFMFFAGPRILHLFGAAYASEASTSLRIIALAVIPLIVRSHYVAIARVFGLLSQAAALVVVSSTLEISGAAAGAVVGGLPGLSAGWLLGVCVGALLMAPSFRRVFIGRTPASSLLPSSTEPAAAQND